MEYADRTFEWDDEALELSARADIMCAELQRQNKSPSAQPISGEDALLWVISGQAAAPELQERIDETKAVLATKVAGRRPTDSPDETRADRARRRYHEDAEYRERVKADMRRRRNSDEFRARERERKRIARAAAKSRAT